MKHYIFGLAQDASLLAIAFVAPISLINNLTVRLHLMISYGDIYRESTISLLSVYYQQTIIKKDPEGIFPRTFGVDESAS